MSRSIIEIPGKKRAVFEPFLLVFAAVFVEKQHAE